MRHETCNFFKILILGSCSVREMMNFLQVEDIFSTRLRTFF